MTENVKLRLNAFCAWGDGPDVGINVYDPENEYVDGYELTPDEALELAADLIRSAERAKELDRSYDEYVRRDKARRTGRH